VDDLSREGGGGTTIGRGNVFAYSEGSMKAFQKKERGESGKRDDLIPGGVPDGNQLSHTSMRKRDNERGRYRQIKT